MNKSEIRKRILKIRKKNINKNFNINFNYINKILQDNKIFNKVIGGYYPYNNEIDAIEILKKFEKNNFISLPKIKKNFQMDFYEWSSKDPLVINKYGIPEPISKNVSYPDILFVPLVGYDDKLNRLGYGGGFYDRYISRIEKDKKIIKIGLAFSFQKLNKIPTTQHDKKLDFIITEKDILK